MYSSNLVKKSYTRQKLPPETCWVHYLARITLFSPILTHLTGLKHWKTSRFSCSFFKGTLFWEKLIKNSRNCIKIVANRYIDAKLPEESIKIGLELISPTVFELWCFRCRVKKICHFLKLFHAMGETFTPLNHVRFW